MGKTKNDCRYFESGYCRLLGGKCQNSKHQQECDNFETSGLDKERTVERNKARKEKRNRERE